MGFWTGLADIGLGIAAPFTGGASLAAIPAVNGIASALSDTGQVAGGAAAASAAGRAQTAGINQNQDRNALGLYDAQLKGAQQALNQNSQLASQAARGDLMSNVQDVNFTNLPPGVHTAGMTGGLRPSDLGPNARQAGQTLSRNALLQLLQGPTNLPKAPTLTPLPDANGFDKFNQILGYGGSMAGALSPLFGPQQGQPGSSGFAQGNTFPGGMIPPVNPEDQGNAFPLGSSLFGGG
jgi:hypothetical protein